VYVFVDNDTDPTNGATAVGNPTVYTIGTPVNAFVDITLDKPLVLNGPGDVIIALSNPNATNVGARPAALDAGPDLGRSYIGDPAPDGSLNPDLSTLNLAPMSVGCCTRNAIIRASGTNTSGAPIVLGGCPGPVVH